MRYPVGTEVEVFDDVVACQGSTGFIVKYRQVAWTTKEIVDLERVTRGDGIVYRHNQSFYAECVRPTEDQEE